MDTTIAHHFHRSLSHSLGLLQNTLTTYPIRSTAAFVCLAVLAKKVDQDYRAWISLGPGGCPHNFAGYILCCCLKLLSSGNVKQTLCFEPLVSSGPSLSDLPIRAGAAPVISKWVVPVRQISARADKAMLEKVTAMVDKVAAEHDLVFTAPSAIEGGHCTALFIQADHTDKEEAQKPAKNREMFHYHSEGSAHVLLSPADAICALDRGWGERHPLSGYFGMGFTYSLIYSPRNDEELEVLRRVAHATIDYALERRKRREL